MENVCIKFYDEKDELVSFYVDTVPSLRKMDFPVLRKAMSHPGVVRFRTIVNGVELKKEE